VSNCTGQGDALWSAEGQGDRGRGVRELQQRAARNFCRLVSFHCFFEPHVSGFI